jgi:hypothetical protein
MIEFYLGDIHHHVATVRAGGAVPRQGELVNIRKTTYRVTEVTWTVDYADNWLDTRMAANVLLAKEA